MSEGNGKLELAIGTLAEILAADDTAADGITVDVPEWGVAVRVRGLTRGEVQTMTQQEADQREPFALATALLEPSVTQEEAYELCNAKSFAATQRVFDRIIEVSGLGDQFREGTADPAVP